MQVIIGPSVIQGIAQAPASKSSMQRACAAALLCKGETLINNAGKSQDDRASLGLIESMGAHSSWLDTKTLKVSSHGIHPRAREVNCGESGLGIRMFTPILALSNQRIIINGSGSLLSRPIDFFEKVLPQVSVRVSTTRGKLPMTIEGPLVPADITMDGSLSSQYLTGMLMAYSAAGASIKTIRVNNLQSRPYIDLTLSVMKEFGMHLPENRDYQEFFFPAPGSVMQNNSRTYQVEGDWSGGAFLLVAGAIGGEVRVNGLDLKSTQADRAVMDALEICGADLNVQERQILVRSNNRLSGFVFDATDCPDLFPPLVALASYCEGQTTISGVNRLLHKESNRALTLQEEFGKMGVVIHLEEDQMLIQGQRQLRGAHVESRHDHRIAMACAVAALRADRETSIAEAQAVSKSYPDFFEDLKAIGANVHSPYSLSNH